MFIETQIRTTKETQNSHFSITVVGLWGIGFGLWRRQPWSGSMNNFMIVVLGVVNLFLGAFMTCLSDTGKESGSKTQSINERNRTHTTIMFVAKCIAYEWFRPFLS